jgi:NAD(P)-dependent dehydrogenase (short-subunit alcohol dehydrogenase family)
MMENSNQSTIVIITGATGAIGKAIAFGIAQNKNMDAVLVARDEGKLKSITSEIGRDTGNPNLRYLVADLSRQIEIQAIADQWQGPLHVLINNAASCPRRRQETPEGIEFQFATNVLGYFWMTLAFGDILEKSAPARIINVASYWAGDLDINDLEFKRRDYSNGIAYRQSKQANRMLTVAFAERFDSRGISVNSCHPGDVNSKLSNDLGFGGFESPAQAAKTPVWLATDPIGIESTGKYFSHLREERCRFGENHQAIEQLFQKCSLY